MTMLKSALWVQILAKRMHFGLSIINSDLQTVRIIAQLRGQQQALQDFGISRSQWDFKISVGFQDLSGISRSHKYFQLAQLVTQ